MLDARSDRDAIGLLKKRPSKAMISFITLVAFLFNTVSYDYAWAVRTPSALTSVGADSRAVSPVSPGAFKELNVKTFNLPQSLGTVKDSWSPTTPATKHQSLTTIIHIQDAHCNYYAQHAISDILAYLSKEYGAGTINLEGGAKDYDLSIFTSIKDQSMRERVADYFVKEGLVNGAEYFALNNPDKASLWGIEDTKLYIDNLKVYRDSLKTKDDTDRLLKNLSYILTNLKMKIYSKELLELDLKYNQYKTNSLEFKDYLNYLIANSKDKMIDIKSFPDIFLLNQTLKTEGEIDFSKANNQRDELIDKMQKRLSKNALRELVAKTVEFKTEMISQEEFYRYLINKANSADISIENFPELEKYIVYISTYAAVDKARIIDEVTALENKIRETLYQNAKQRELDKLSKNLAILRNIFNISLTRADYQYYKANEASFDMRNYSSFIGREAPLCKISARLDDGITRLDSYREQISKFYEYSFKRDVAFLKNLSAKRYPLNANHAAIVITGGFHTENLAELFKKQGIAYISIIPNFKSSSDYACPYFDILAGTKQLKIDPEIKMMVKGATLATPDPFTKLAIDVEDAGIKGIVDKSSISTALELKSSIPAKPAAEQVTAPSAAEQKTPDIEKLVSESNILNSFEKNGAISVSELISRLRTHTAGVMSIQEFMHEYRAKTVGGYSLGLSTGSDIYIALSRILGLADWITAYREKGIGITSENHTSKFLNAITAENDKPIVFFIPDHTRPEGVTRDEIKWIADHLNEPGLRKIFLVFGAYDGYFPKNVLQGYGKIALNEFWKKMAEYAIEDLQRNALSAEERKSVAKEIEDNTKSYDERANKSSGNRQPGALEDNRIKDAIRNLDEAVDLLGKLQDMKLFYDQTFRKKLSTKLGSILSPDEINHITNMLQRSEGRSDYIDSLKRQLGRNIQALSGRSQEAPQAVDGAQKSKAEAAFSEEMEEFLGILGLLQPGAVSKKGNHFIFAGASGRFLIVEQKDGFIINVPIGKGYKSLHIWINEQSELFEKIKAALNNNIAPAAAKPVHGVETGSWFPDNEEWTRSAWLRETGLSIFAGGIAWVMLSMVGLQDYAAYIVPVVSALTFQVPHRTRAFNPTVAFLTTATLGAVFLAVTNPILGAMAIIGVMIVHRHINLPNLSQSAAPSVAAAKPAQIAAPSERIASVMSLLKDEKAQQAMTRLANDTNFSNAYNAAEHLLINGTQNVEKVLARIFNRNGTPQEEYIGELVSAYAMERAVKYSKVTAMSEERFGSEIDFILDVSKDRHGENIQGKHELEDGAYIVESKTEGLGVNLDVIHHQLLAHKMPPDVTKSQLVTRKNKTKLENYTLNALRMREAYERGDTKEYVVGIIFAVGGDAVMESGIAEFDMSELEPEAALAQFKLTMSEAYIPDAVISRTEETGQVPPKVLKFVNDILDGHKDHIDASRREEFFNILKDTVMKNGPSRTQFKIMELLKEAGANPLSPKDQTKEQWESVFKALAAQASSAVAPSAPAAPATTVTESRLGELAQITDVVELRNQFNSMTPAQLHDITILLIKAKDPKRFIELAQTITFFILNKLEGAIELPEEEELKLIKELQLPLKRCDEFFAIVDKAGYPHDSFLTLHIKAGLENLDISLKALSVELAVKDAANMNGTKFYGVQDPLYPSGRRGIAGHVTSYNGLLHIIFDSDGILKPQREEIYTYFAVGAEGVRTIKRSGRYREAGIVPLVIPYAASRDEDVTLRKMGQTHLSGLTPESKRLVWITIQNIFGMKSEMLDKFLSDCKIDISNISEEKVISALSADKNMDQIAKELAVPKETLALGINSAIDAVKAIREKRATALAATANAAVNAQKDFTAEFGKNAEEVLQFVSNEDIKTDTIESYSKKFVQEHQGREVFSHEIALKGLGAIIFYTKRNNRPIPVFFNDEATVMSMAYQNGLGPNARAINSGKILVMQNAAGKRLDEILLDETLSADERAKIRVETAEEVMYALGRLHGLKIVHGDVVMVGSNVLMESNIIISEDGRAVFIDFANAFAKEINRPPEKGAFDDEREAMIDALQVNRPELEKAYDMGKEDADLLSKANEQTEQLIKEHLNRILDRLNSVRPEDRDKVRQGIMKLFDLARSGKETIQDRDGLKERKGINHLKALLVGVKPGWLNFAELAGTEVTEFIQNDDNKGVLNVLGLGYIPTVQGPLLYNKDLVNAILKRDGAAINNYLKDKGKEKINFDNEKEKEIIEAMLKADMHLTGIVLGYRLEDVIDYIELQSSGKLRDLGVYAIGSVEGDIPGKHPGLIEPFAQAQSVIVIPEKAEAALAAYLPVQAGINTFEEIYNKLRSSILTQIPAPSTAELVKVDIANVTPVLKTRSGIVVNAREIAGIKGLTMTLAELDKKVPTEWVTAKPEPTIQERADYWKGLIGSEYFTLLLFIDNDGTITGLLAYTFEESGKNARIWDFKTQTALDRLGGNGKRRGTSLMSAYFLQLQELQRQGMMATWEARDDESKIFYKGYLKMAGKTAAGLENLAKARLSYRVMVDQWSMPVEAAIALANAAPAAAAQKTVLAPGTTVTTVMPPAGIVTQADTAAVITQTVSENATVEILTVLPELIGAGISPSELTSLTTSEEIENFISNPGLTEKIKGLLKRWFAASHEYSTTVAVLDEGDNKPHSVYVITIDGNTYILEVGDKGTFTTTISVLGTAAPVSVNIVRHNATPALGQAMAANAAQGNISRGYKNKIIMFASDVTVEKGKRFGKARNLIRLYHEVDGAETRPEYYQYKNGDDEKAFRDSIEKVLEGLQSDARKVSKEEAKRLDPRAALFVPGTKFAESGKTGWEIVTKMLEDPKYDDIRGGVAVLSDTAPQAKDEKLLEAQHIDFAVEWLDYIRNGDKYTDDQKRALAEHVKTCADAAIVEKMSADDVLAGIKNGTLALKMITAVNWDDWDKEQDAYIKLRQAA